MAIGLAQHILIPLSHRAEPLVGKSKDCILFMGSKFGLGCVKSPPFTPHVKLTQWSLAQRGSCLKYLKSGLHNEQF